MMRQEVLTNGHNTVNIPLNLKRFIWLAQNMFNCGPDKPPVPDLMATEIVDRMQVGCCGVVLGTAVQTRLFYIAL